MVKIKKTKQRDKGDELPMFKLMSETELEVAARKEKAHSANFHGSRTQYGKRCLFYFYNDYKLLHFAETEEGRIKQKQLELKSKISDNDFQFQVAKILKWLEKGQFVSVSIKVASRGSKEDAESLKKRIEKFIADNSDVITNASRLSIKV